MGTKPLRYEPVVEDISTHMHYILDKQQEGVLPRDVAFFWDSVGSINCFKGATSKTTNNQSSNFCWNSSDWNILKLQIKPYKQIIILTSSFMWAVIWNPVTLSDKTKC